MAQNGTHKNEKKNEFGFVFVYKSLKTSSARSATLEDTSWALLHFASWNLPDSQFCSKSKTEPKCSRHRTKLEGTPHRKSVYWHTYFLNRVPIGRWTPHILSEQGANRGGGTPHIKTGFQYSLDSTFHKCSMPPYRHSPGGVLGSHCCFMAFRGFLCVPWVITDMVKRHCTGVSWMANEIES